MAGSRKWDVSAPDRGWLDDNNARAFEHGLGWKCKGAYISIYYCFEVMMMWCAFNWTRVVILMKILQHVFDYFTARTPRSHFEHRETSLVWNYKYAGKRLYPMIIWLVVIEFSLSELSFIFCRYWIWKASSKGHATTFVDRPNLQCSCWCCPR